MLRSSSQQIRWQKRVQKTNEKNEINKLMLFYIFFHLSFQNTYYVVASFFFLGNLFVSNSLYLYTVWNVRGRRTNENEWDWEIHIKKIRILDFSICKHFVVFWHFCVQKSRNDGRKQHKKQRIICSFDFFICASLHVHSFFILVFPLFSKCCFSRTPSSFFRYLQHVKLASE